jgi:hypothetical protein
MRRQVLGHQLATLRPSRSIGIPSREGIASPASAGGPKSPEDRPPCDPTEPAEAQ